MSIDLTLDRIRALSNHLQAYTRPTIHIAGTNGKGSVTAFLSSILSASDPPLKVGRFNSPHLVSIYDCISINNENISPEFYASVRTDVENASQEHDLPVSSFETLTLTALQVFERAAVDIVVMEVGVGGRLDATNIISDECVLVSALTTVDLDHQAFLGNSVSAIAMEKASIARKGKPFVLGKQTHAEVQSAVQKVVTDRGADLSHALETVFKRSWDPSIDGDQPSPFSLSADHFISPAPQPVKVDMPCFSGSINTVLPLCGEHQLDNLALALAVICAMMSGPSPFSKCISSQTIVCGVSATRWPGRLSFHSLGIPNRPAPLHILADGAHNAASSLTLSRYITYLLSSLSDSVKQLSITYILALSHSPPKTPLETFTPLLPPRVSASVNVNVAVLRFSPPEGMPWVKSVPLADLRGVVRGLVPDADVWEGDEEDDLRGALKWAAKKDGLVVVAGSLYLVADLYRLLEAGFQS